jgi:hypothetical protein
MSAETVAVIDDMARVFDSNEDIQLIRNINSNMVDILQICQQKEQSVKEIVRGEFCTRFTDLFVKVFILCA